MTTTKNTNSPPSPYRASEDKEEKMDKNNNNKYDALFLASAIFFIAVIGVWLNKYQGIDMTDATVCMIIMLIVPLIILYRFPLYLTLLTVAYLFMIFGCYLGSSILRDININYGIFSPWPIKTKINWLLHDPTFRYNLFNAFIMFMGGRVIQFIAIKNKAKNTNRGKP